MTLISQYSCLNNNYSPVEYALTLSEDYIRNSTIEYRKKRGQFFTPPIVARFMAGLSKNLPIRILDPGAGLGILSCAVIENICNNINRKCEIQIDLYEKDQNIVPLLKKVMEHTRQHFPQVKYKIYPVDFAQEILLKHGNIFGRENILYDLIIANPPYFKIQSTSTIARTAKFNNLQGNTNIYSLIMALSKDLLKDAGEMIFIVPRSFCSGLYFKYFRQEILREMSLDYLHIFNSRRNVFSNDSVLQENIIIKMSKQPQKQTIKISSSYGIDDLPHAKADLVDVRKVIDTKSGLYTIRIPLSNEDEQIMDIVHNWNASLSSLNMAISTGPIVSYRSKSWLAQNQTEYPLICLNNVKPMEISWPITHPQKPQYVKKCPESSKWLVPNSNYILLRRFSAKEERQRLVATPLLKNRFNTAFIGIENHLNFIYRPKGTLTIDETYGIAALLNSRILNRYFQIINGHTQVNATELQKIPLPQKEAIIEMGKLVRTTNQIDNIVFKILQNIASKSERLVLANV